MTAMGSQSVKVSIRDVVKVSVGIAVSVCSSCSKHSSDDEFRRIMRLCSEPEVVISSLGVGFDIELVIFNVVSTVPVEAAMSAAA